MNLTLDPGAVGEFTGRSLCPETVFWTHKRSQLGEKQTKPLRVGCETGKGQRWGQWAAVMLHSHYLLLLFSFKILRWQLIFREKREIGTLKNQNVVFWIVTSETMGFSPSLTLTVNDECFCVVLRLEKVRENDLRCAAKSAMCVVHQRERDPDVTLWLGPIKE